MDPATAAGLAFGVASLMISVLENYEYTFQAPIIFTRRYMREVKRIQQALDVQRLVFTNECCLLLHAVTQNRGKVMTEDLEHPLWREEDLESRLATQLSNSYKACGSALSLIDPLLAEIVEKTEALGILQRKKSERSANEWGPRLRQRLKISFTKDNFDDKLMELENRIQSFKTIREQMQQIKLIEDGPSVAPEPCIDQFRVIQRASQRLHEVLSSFWPCESPSEHSANICLDIMDDNHSPNICFDLMWSCPIKTQSVTPAAQPLQKLLIETVKPHIAQDPPFQRPLESALRLAIGSQSSVGNGEAHLRRQGANLAPSTVSSEMVSDLGLLPNLCQHLIENPASNASTRCIGYFQKDGSFKHLIYASQGPPNSSLTVKSLKDALKAAKNTGNGIPFPERFSLAKRLALAVLQFHSTPWLNEEWRSSDIIFFGIRDFMQDPLDLPFLKSRVFARARREANVPVTTTNSASIRSPIRNKTLHNLGVLLLELAYSSPLDALQIPEDDQGDPWTLYWTAERLGEKVEKELGPKYAAAVKICLRCGFGASGELQHMKVQKAFYDEVVQKLDEYYKAVSGI